MCATNEFRVWVWFDSAIMLFVFFCASVQLTQTAPFHESCVWHVHVYISIEIERVRSADCHTIASFASGTIYRIHFLDVMWFECHSSVLNTRLFAVPLFLSLSLSEILGVLFWGQRISSAKRNGERKHSYEIKYGSCHSRCHNSCTE